MIPIEIEGVKGIRYAPSGSATFLHQAAEGAPDARLADPSVAFIAPLDPLLWDRRVLRDVWEFEYVWEVYVPEAKRRWGYYVMPILYRDRLVGRIEPRVDRVTRTLRILGIWWEAGFSPRKAPGFVPQMREALRAYMSFVGAETVEWLPAARTAGRLFGTLKRS